jgi:hypothetical protein
MKNLHPAVGKTSTALRLSCAAVVLGQGLEKAYFLFDIALGIRYFIVGLYAFRKYYLFELLGSKKGKPTRCLQEEAGFKSSL